MEVRGTDLAPLHGMPSDTCPLCGAPVALIRSRTPHGEADILRDRIATLRQRAEDLEQGDITPRQLKDELLWMCADCQRVMTDLPALDRPEIQRRIHEEARQLEHRRARHARHAS
jgi:hypothetical protein